MDIIVFSQVGKKNSLLHPTEKDSLGGVRRKILYYPIGVKHNNGVVDPTWEVQRINSE